METISKRLVSWASLIDGKTGFPSRPCPRSLVIVSLNPPVPACRCSGPTAHHAVAADTVRIHAPRNLVRAG